jgi:glycosyltransferase involved in cell wall biosynthesis
VIHPAVDPDRFRPRPPVPVAVSTGLRPLRVAVVGSLIWRKDLEHGLLAVRRALDAGADLHIDLVGDGPDVQHVRFLVDDLALDGRVHLLGPLPPADVAAVLREADVFLHASCAEGVSNAVLEAMATGLAVVTTDAGGMREAVRDEVDGLVVPVQDAAALGHALTRVAADRSLRARLGASARRRVEAEFRLADQVDAFVDLLREAAGTPAPVRSGGGR